MLRSLIGYFVKVLLSGCVFSHQLFAVEISSDIPFKPDGGELYLFYQHAKVMEQQGIPARHEKFGEYAYLAILKRLHAQNLNVIAEWRPAGAKLHAYAFRVARKVTKLIENGVPANNITVAGVDKGGKLTLLVASYVGDARVNYVILGGCPANEQKARELVEQFELMPNGRILSIRDLGHQASGSCRPLLTEAEQGLQYHDLDLSSGLGQKLFYTPDRRWIQPLVSWARGSPL